MYSIGINNFVFKGKKQQAYRPKDFTGTVEKTNKKGENFILKYRDGKIKSSTRKGEEREYKIYLYNNIQEYTSDEIKFDRHKFADGMQLDSDQFYSTGKPEEFMVITRPDKSTAHYYFALINKNAVYNDEPLVKSWTSTFHFDTLCGSKAPVKTVFKSGGQEKFEFKTLNEAKEYFASEYGIDADFMNLKQAFITKEAIDDFVKLNYQGRGKRIFEGLKIACAPLDEETLTKAYCNIGMVSEKLPENTSDLDFNDPNCSEEEFENKAIDFLKTLDDDCIKLNYNTIILNSNYDWDLIEQDLKKCCDENFHQTSECKYGIEHEFIHYLHSRNIPIRQYLIMEEFDDDNQAEIAKEAGSYAATNPLEFVAEYGSARMTGKKYSKAAAELYKKFSGPDLWGDSATFDKA